METISETSIERPTEWVEGPTRSGYAYDIETTEIQGEGEETVTAYAFKRVWFLPGEYARLCDGTLPSGAEWDDATHTLFREHQHARTDTLYAKAYRMKRTSEDPDAWGTYIDELDAWNSEVSALAETYGTDVPDLPTMPAA